MKQFFDGCARILGYGFLVVIGLGILCSCTSLIWLHGYGSRVEDEGSGQVPVEIPRRRGFPEVEMPSVECHLNPDKVTEIRIPTSEVGNVYVPGLSLVGYPTPEPPWRGAYDYFGYWCRGSSYGWALDVSLSTLDDKVITLVVEKQLWSTSESAIEALRRGSDSGGAIYGWSPETLTPVILIGNGK